MATLLRRVALLAILALFMAPLSAYATEGDSYALDVTTEVEGNSISVTATIENAETATSGEWKIVPFGKNNAGKPATQPQSEELSFSGTWNDLAPGEYCFKVHYTGKLDGATSNTVLKKDKVCATVEGVDEPGDENGNDGEEPSNEEPKEEEPEESPVTECTDLENLDPEDFHEITIDQKDAGDSIKVTATLPGNNVDGAWEFMAGLWDAEEPDVVETKIATEKTVTFSIPKSKLAKEGDYLILVVFSGTIDGKECQWGIGLDGFYLEDEEGAIAPPTKDVPKPTTPEGKERVIKNAKGGKMPNTAAPMVTNFALGALMMVAGVGLLVYRRFSF
ncbi:hypothetical protein [Desmospora activa]|uniref:LPXTG-motif cell wall-anchored protein n=1 Tax=Desmospora activa DSM 45169 TaxID=1121389 RepID=A0A2T4Z7S7_9BACL|nr:hypothetical protein [Desmospora activa]PTM57925.1 hypothetical protein C8J48_0493 [Desmospora activa DSM 45169]